MRKTERRQWRRFGVFIANFEHISHFGSSVFIVNLEQVNAPWANCDNIFLRMYSVLLKDNYEESMYP